MDFFTNILVKVSNSKIFSKTLFSFTNSPCSKFLIKPFIRKYKIDLSDVEKDLSEFNSLAEFFSRKLKSSARPIQGNEKNVVSPVDGKIVAQGNINEMDYFFVKNHKFSLEKLLGKKEYISEFRNGLFQVIYLSPANYHRIHAPFDANLIERFSLGDKSYPVNEFGLNSGREVLATNYRVINLLESNFLKFLTVYVGATNVNSIVINEKSPSWKKGDEVAYFSFGSTVILFYPKDSVILSNTTLPHNIRVGEVIAEIKN